MQRGKCVAGSHEMVQARSSRRLGGDDRPLREERGYYNTLIDLLYARAPHHDVTDVLVVKAMGERPQVWRRVKARLIAKGKVKQDANGNLHANRVETEVKLAVNRMNKNGVSGTTSAKINDLMGTELQLQPIENLCKGSREAEYRSPPRKKSDNVLTPFPDKPLRTAKHKAAAE